MEFKKITEGTLIPVSLVLSLLGFSSWLTVIWAQGNANAQAIDTMQEDRKTLARRQNDKLDDILQRLSRIEGKLDHTKRRDE